MRALLLAGIFVIAVGYVGSYLTTKSLMRPRPAYAVEAANAPVPPRPVIAAAPKAPPALQEVARFLEGQCQPLPGESSDSARERCMGRLFKQPDSVVQARQPEEYRAPAMYDPAPIDPDFRDETAMAISEAQMREAETQWREENERRIGEIRSRCPQLDIAPDQDALLMDIPPECLMDQ